jgi:hypothetical protein
MPAQFRLTKKMEETIYHMIRAEKMAASPKEISDEVAFKNLVKRWESRIS